MRDACTFPMVRRSRLAPDSHLRKLKQSKAQEQLANEMALVSEPGEADDLGSVCTTTQLVGTRYRECFSCMSQPARSLDLGQSNLCSWAGPKGLPKIERYLSRSQK